MLQPDLGPLDKAFDQPPHHGARRLLCICTTPRSGSHRLGRALYELGLGITTEYFHASAINALADRWGLAGDRTSAAWLDRYWQQIVRRRTRGGVIAVSMFGTQIGILKRLVSPADAPIFVHLYRRNAAEQIASLLALYHTKMPYEGQQQLPDLPGIGEISARSIRILDQWFRLQNRKWRDFLADKSHLTTSSEDFFASPRDVLRAILAQGAIAVSPSRLDAAADFVRGSRRYSVNAKIKRQLLQDHAASFVALADAGPLAES